MKASNLESMISFSFSPISCGELSGIAVCLDGFLKFLSLCPIPKILIPKDRIHFISQEKVL